MTKTTFQAFCAKQGWLMSYSGKNKGIYINPKRKEMSLDDIEIAVIQHFGILPDYKLFLA